MAWRSHLLCLRRHPVLCLRKLRHVSLSSSLFFSATKHSKRTPSSFLRYGKSALTVEPLSDSANESDDLRASKWNEPEWEKAELGMKMASVSKPTRVVLSALRKNGHEVYLVGGCVRDLILKRTPKDFDIITSAELKEVRKTFTQCDIVGTYTIQLWGFLALALALRILVTSLITSRGHQAATGITFVGGIACAGISPLTARILRSVRIAARLGFRFTKDMALSLKELSCSVRRLDKGRILMEMNYMMAFGYSEASTRLLWRFGLLGTLLPIQSLFSNRDRVVAPNQPCHSSLTLWIAIIAILAFHKALVDQPRDSLVVSALCLAISGGGSLSAAIDIARTISRLHETRFDEVLEPAHGLSEKALTDEVVDLVESIKAVLRKMTDRDYVSRAMIKFPKAPRSNLVVIPVALSLRVCKIFECVRREIGRDFDPEIAKRINYETLALGSLPEVQSVFATVVFNTIYPTKLKY